ncbi:DUF5908 family protein [Flavivirga jejuensis]|uniref:DUF5908 family protein n=1 Tax=Flavivirga jejuensis TaxID=870487 RepID=A0ABT8WQ02_9FLAO|nr:DUF5908 family protein [Flavivirga jejuensis]MDO5975216.1 DUF5908 family protein [Flavivirga jejuensis]
MPIEIKELHIKINVNDSNQSNASANKAPGGNAANLISTCIEKVFEIQDRKNER